tara:strand:+ start:466 stop:729 length:264 start_codon:yes stop_codon:yes gene_type:complete
MQQNKLLEICKGALQDLKVSSELLENPTIVVLKGSSKHLKSFQLVLFLMEIESKIEDLEIEVDLFNLADSMGDELTLGELIDKLSTI